MQQDTACNAASFATFWSGFRAAVISGELTVVEASVADTFAIRGPMDGDSLIRVPSSEFRVRWASLMQQDPGLQMEPETLMQFVQRTATVPAQALDSLSSSARIADLVFQCNGGRWHLTRAYTSD